MWPRSLPREVVENPLRSAEIKVYRVLADALGAPFTVFYSRPWLGLTPSGAERDGECDFAIAHADLGLLMLEVKGGAISCDPHSARWTSRDRHGFTHNIKDPVSQARSSKHNILEKLKKAPGWKPRRIRARHGIVLPDCVVPSGGLSADAPRELVCSLDDMGQIRDWVLARMGAGKPFSDGEGPLGKDGVGALEKLLAHPFTLTVPLGHRLAEDELALGALTPQQFHILEAIQDIPRAGIAGGAGTGKTVLAVEEAKRFAGEGCKTLLVCHSNPLAANLKRRLHGVANVEAATFHEVCLRMAASAGIEFTSSDTSEFFDEQAPDLLMRAVQAEPALCYDVIIADEGQDFRLLWWIALDALLRRSSHSRLHIFYDCNQRVYDRGGRPPDDVHLVPIRLSRNLRNTRRIHEAAMRHYTGFEVFPNELEGLAVEAVPVATESAALAWVGEEVRRVTGTERVAPEDIAVLAASPGLVAKLVRTGRLGGELTCNAAAPDEDAVTVDTIRRFKGLEASVILLLATDEILAAPELAYVALSRPRTRLVIVGSEAVLDALLKSG